MQSHEKYQASLTTPKKCNGITREWWKETVTYQVYPRTFQDSNNDGIGDIQGIIQRIPYLASLNIGCIWLSPVCKSPQDDNGYDVSDYMSIDPLFGDTSDIQALIHELHRHNIKLCMDLVVNHTSSQHEWFKMSSDPSHPLYEKYKDYYIWSKKPNNWESYFSGSTWTYNEKRQEYYLHLFAESQPDLNWDNADVREEVYNMMQYWLDQDIDGFRMDVINMLSKEPGFPDNIIDNHTLNSEETESDGMKKRKYVFGTTHFINGPHIHEYLREMNERVLTLERNQKKWRGVGSGSVIAIGETVDVNTSDALKYTGEQRKELGLLFQFEHQIADNRSNDKWDIDPVLYDAKEIANRDVHPYFKKYKSILSKWQYELFDPDKTRKTGFGWNSLYHQNHDQPRILSRYGHNGTRELQSLSAKSLALMLHCLCGTPFVYQGEELGMTNLNFTDISQIQDIETRNMYFDYINNHGIPVDTVLKMINYRSREHARSVMQWTSKSKYAGFSEVAPDRRILCDVVNPNFRDGITAEDEERDPNSILNFYRKLTSLRSDLPENSTRKELIVYGDFEEVLSESDSVFAYWRTIEGYSTGLFAVASLNKSESGLDFASIKIPKALLKEPKSNISFTVLLSNYEQHKLCSINRESNTISLQLRPCESALIEFSIN